MDMIVTQAPIPGVVSKRDVELVGVWLSVYIVSKWLIIARSFLKRAGGDLLNIRWRRANGGGGENSVDWK